MKGHVWLSCSCHTKYHTWGLKTADTGSLMALEAKSLKSRCGQGPDPWRALGEERSLPVSSSFCGPPASPGIPWLTDVPLLSLPGLHVATVPLRLSVCAQIFPRSLS